MKKLFSWPVQALTRLGQCFHVSRSKRTGSETRTNRASALEACDGGTYWGHHKPSLAYVDSVHSAQKSEGIWLADHPLVQGVRVAIAPPDEIARFRHPYRCHPYRGQDRLGKQYNAHHVPNWLAGRP